MNDCTLKYPTFCIMTSFFLPLTVNGEAKFLAVNHKLEVLCYATRELLLTDILSNLIIPGLVQQLHSLKNKILPYLLKQQPVVRLLASIDPLFITKIISRTLLSYLYVVGKGNLYLCFVLLYMGFEKISYFFHGAMLHMIIF